MYIFKQRAEEGVLDDMADENDVWWRMQEEGVLYDAADENDEDEYGESKLNGCTDLDLDLQIINDSL